MTLDELYQLIQARKQDRPAGSYTASLFEAGLDRIAQKVGEEAVEVVIASKNARKEEFSTEVADLLYHLLVLMVEKDVALDDVERILASRAKM